MLRSPLVYCSKVWNRPGSI